MNSTLLIQPDAGGRISGGYLYNQKMREHGAWDVLDVQPEELGKIVLPRHVSLVLLDSIWLTEEYLPELLRLLRPGLRSKWGGAGALPVGVVLHSLPSLIAASEAGLPVPEGPTEFEFQALRDLDLMVAVGPHYPEMFRAVPIEVVIASPGLEKGWRQAPRPRQGPCRLISVGAVSARKGFAEVAQALASHPPSQEWRWDIVGSKLVDPEYAALVGRSVARWGGSVVLHGQLPPEQTRALVLQADLLVMPSFDENHPLVLLEAMAASTVPVAYAAGAARAMVEHNCQGLIANVGDSSALGEHLLSLIDDKAQCQRLAEGCWRAQEKLPNWAQAAAQAGVKLSQFLAAAAG